MKLSGRLRISACGPIGLDVGSRAIKAVQAAPAGDGTWRLEAAVSVPRAEPGAPLSERELERLLGVLDRHGFVGTEFAIASPPEALMSAALELPPRSPGVPIEQIARLELARSHRRDPASFEMAVWDVPIPSRAGEGTHLMAVACPHEGVEAVLTVFDALGMDVSSVDVRPCALARACSPLAGAAPGMTAILELGWSRGLLVLLYQNVVVYERTMEEGAVGALHAKVRDLLGADPDVVDYVLGVIAPRTPPSERRRVGEVPGRAGRLVSAFVEGLVRELSLSLGYISGRYPATAGGGRGAVDRLLLAGGGALMPGLASRLADGLNVEARVITAADLAAAPDEILPECSSPALVAALGLAQRRRGGGE